MNPLALALVLVAAVSHAGWNLLSKQAAKADAVVFLWLVAAASTVLWTPAALVTGAVPSWRMVPLICVSTALHLAYFVLLQRGYRHGDLSVVYPVARGTGPMLASAAAVLFLGEHPTHLGVAGILLVGIGVFLLSGGGVGDVRGLLFGLMTGVFIAGYTLWDAQLVKESAVAPMVLIYLGELFRMLAITPFALGERRRLVAEVWREHWTKVLGAAVLVPLSYLLALFAFRLAPVSVVAPMREVSVLIAVVMGGRLLAEGDLRRRLLAAGVILGGMVAIAVS
ncbi:EamA family transporter [Nonomuraea africana]|uniref:Drug/metabolite transporter (DMT)-like permease n=1 Tax=Nonomuraea africana TaxID=46171 RepID=A0ABR9KTH1_9ACTN|nr:EamA family transporter [Nonomuraea africana]MBE1564913.1 drug/metabolite transporter (DMT)-like permease [Nonomuraea africana]